MLNLFRRLLIELRRFHRLDRRRGLIYLLGFLVVVASLSLVLDYFTPFYGIWMIVRSLWLIPTALGVFSLAYYLSIHFHNLKEVNDEDWVAYRIRYSQRSRIQMSIVMGAFLLVWIYVIPKDTGYTLLSSFIGAGFLGIAAFIRPTNAEYKRRLSGVPDPRDVAYDFGKREYLRKVALEKEQKKAMTREERKVSKKTEKILEEDG